MNQRKVKDFPMRRCFFPGGILRVVVSRMSVCQTKRQTAPEKIRKERVGRSNQRDAVDRRKTRT